MQQKGLVRGVLLMRFHLIITEIIFIGFICYDDACHLKRFARNPVRADLTEQSKQLASVEMVVDRMHMKAHIDPWCREHCDASKDPELKKVLSSNIKVGMRWAPGIMDCVVFVTWSTFP